MIDEVPAIRKLPMAVRLRSLQRSRPGVCALMNSEAADHAERLVASWKITFVGALIGMRTHVLRQGT